MARLGILSHARMGAGAEEVEIGHRVAIDIRGTFTDPAAVDVWTGELVVSKASSTPARLDHGVMAALDRSGVPASSVESLVHGTAVVINAITERRGVPTVLVTTRGSVTCWKSAGPIGPTCTTCRTRSPCRSFPAGIGSRWPSGCRTGVMSSRLLTRRSCAPWPGRSRESSPRNGLPPRSGHQKRGGPGPALMAFRKVATRDWLMRSSDDWQIKRRRTSQQPPDPSVDLVADRAPFLDRLARGVSQLPVEVPFAGKDRTGVPATHRHDHVRRFDDVSCERFRELLRQIEPELVHRLPCAHADLASGSASGVDRVVRSTGRLAGPRRQGSKKSGLHQLPSDRTSK